MELEGYDKQLQEFQNFSDLLEVKRYLKKAQGLQAKLEEAAEKIEGFNNEEDAFEWDRTQYPLKTKVTSTLLDYFIMSVQYLSMTLKQGNALVFK